MQDLDAAIDRLSPLTSEARLALRERISPRAVAAGEHLLRAGEVATRCYFLRRGLMREYYLDIAGRESTRQFAVAGTFSGSLADLLSAAPAEVSIEALVPSQVFEMEWPLLDALAERHPSLQKLLRRTAEDLYLRKVQREFEMLSLSAAERYQRFIQQYPDLDARLHRHQVASYLGITPVHLSRLGAGRKRGRST